jgi:hypothetical protein
VRVTRSDRGSVGRAERATLERSGGERKTNGCRRIEQTRAATRRILTDHERWDASGGDKVLIIRTLIKIVQYRMTRSYEKS